jgi:hypothetical protein
MDTSSGRARRAPGRRPSRGAVLAGLAGTAVAACLAGLAAPVTASAGPARSAAPAGSAGPAVIADPGAGKGSAVTNASSLGVNGASWDGHYLDSSIPGLLSGAHLGLVRYPGGSWGDEYDWQTNTVAGQTNPVDFGQFSSVTRQAHAGSFVTVNYGSGTPDEAAAWVNDAKSQPGHQVALWEVGNENYGPWETDNHPSPHTPGSYAQNSAPFFQAMHQADPDARLGFPFALTAQQAAGTGTGVPDPAQWNATILGQDGGLINFADTHWYPFYGTPTLTPDQIMGTVRTIPSVMDSIRSTLNRYDPRAAVVIGETSISNAEITYNVQPIAALFAAGTALEWLSQGAQSVDWWDIHNYGTPQGDFGMLSSGTSGEPPVNTPFPAYYGYALASLLTAPGARLSAVKASSPAVTAFASRSGQSESVMVINSDSTAPVSVSVRGMSGTGTGPGREQVLRSYTYSAANPQIAQGSTTASAARNGIRLPPQSIEVLKS